MLVPGLTGCLEWLFRASLLSQGLAGIQNVDVTDHIEGHSSYLWTTQHTLEELELETHYPVYNNILPKEQTRPNFTVSFLSIRNITTILQQQILSQATQNHVHTNTANSLRIKPSNYQVS